MENKNGSLNNGDVRSSVPPENVMAELREMFQSLTESLNSQKKEISELRQKIDYLVQLSGNPQEQAKPDIKADVKIDRFSSEPPVDGEKEEREISDSWEEILASVGDGSYREKYKIGNYKPLDLGSEGIIRMQIAGFDADPLADGSGKAAITWIAMDLMRSKHRMNPFYEEGKIGTGALGGWKESEMRKYLEQTVRPMIPAPVCDFIKKVNKYSLSMDNYYIFINNEETQDHLWIPSITEVLTAKDMGEELDAELLKKAESNTVYYDLFSGNDESVKKASWWWLRSAGGSINFNNVSTGGSGSNGYAFYIGGVVLGFCT